MKLKRIMAAGLAATMVMSSGSVVGADNSSTITGGGNGTLEGVVDTDVFNVVLPTVTTDTFNYIADPQGLIAKTDEAHYSGKTFSEGTLFFANAATDKKYDYSNQSDKLNAINKSSKKIKLSVAAKAVVGTSGDSDATLATDADSLSADSPEVYLAITDGTTSKTLKADDEKLEQVLGGAPETAYEYKYEGDKYSYGLKSDVSTCKFAEYSVYVKGEASEKGWKEGTTLPSISVVWTAEFAGEGDAVTIETPEQTPATPTSYVSATKISASSPSVTLTFPVGVTLSNVVLNKTDGTQSTSSTIWSLSGNTFTVRDSILTGYIGATFKLTYSDGHEDVLTIE